MKVADLREARALKVTEMRAMLQKAEQEKRSLTDAEKTAFDNLKGEVTSLEADEQRAAFLQDVERRQSGDPVGDKPAAQLEQRVSLLRVLQAAMEGRALTGAQAASYQTSKRGGPIARAAPSNHSANVAEAYASSPSSKVCTGPESRPLASTSRSTNSITAIGALSPWR